MRTPDSGYVTSILASPESPCLSIYLSTQRTNGNSGGLADSHNRARFRALADQAAESLSKGYASTADGIANQLVKLRTDEGFWSQVLDGVAILASPERFDAFTLPRPVPEYVSVSETFHVKPLLRFVQSAEPFHVLGLSRERVALFRGNRYELHPKKVAGIPLTLTEALGEETDEPSRGFHTSQPTGAARAGPGGNGGAGALISHGQGARKEEILPDMHRFFLIVDREIIQRVSEPSGLPLIPMGIDDNLSEFRAVSKNRFLTEESIHGDWTKLSVQEIRDKAWKVLEKHYLERLATIREDFGTASARGKGTGDLSEAARFAAAGRIGVLLIDADQTHPGRIEMDTGVLHPASSTDGAAGDMLDDLAEIALRTKAKVIVTPSAQMPTQTGLAAICRY